MKFTEAWGSVAAHNVMLKQLVLLLSILLIVSFVINLKLYSKDPILIEKKCKSHVIETAKKDSRSEGEIKTFIEEAILQRFNSDLNINENYFSLTESRFKAEEEKEFSIKKIKQKILITEIKIDKSGDVLVHADRILSIGSIKSVLGFNVAIKLIPTKRSSINPYGLIIERISKVEEKEKETK